MSECSYSIYVIMHMEGGGGRKRGSEREREGEKERRE